MQEARTTGLQPYFATRNEAGTSRIRNAIPLSDVWNMVRVLLLSSARKNRIMIAELSISTSAKHPNQVEAMASRRNFLRSLSESVSTN